MKKLFILIIFLSATIYGEEKKPKVTKPRHVSLPAEIVLEPKSHKKALALSILLPGLGEYYMGSKSDAIRAYAIEAGIWGTFFGGRWYAGVLAKDCILYAHANAGVLPEKEVQRLLKQTSLTTQEYYDAVEWYENLEAYNTWVREEARWLYPDSREEQLKYIEEHGLPDSLWWEWKDESKWDEYRNSRSRRRNILHNTSYCIGAAILNRIFSGIIATHLPVSGLGLKIQPNGFKIYFALR